MLKDVHPKLPMRNKNLTRNFYVQMLDFQEIGSADYGYYLMLEKDLIQLHFFLFENLNPFENYGQIYIRTDQIDTLYQSFLERNTPIHPNGKLSLKPWGQKEFSILDPDHNLITFGQAIDPVESR